MTAGNEHSPSRASDSLYSDRGRDPARRPGGRDDGNRSLGRQPSRSEPTTGSAPSVAQWYFDHDLGIIHRGGRCPTCRAMMDHQMRHRCDDSYQEAVAAREEKQATVVDAAVRRATAHLEASNEALRRNLFRVEDERDDLAAELGRLRSLLDSGSSRRRSSRSRSPPRRSRSRSPPRRYRSRSPAQFSRRDRSPRPSSSGGQRPPAPVAGPSRPSGSGSGPTARSVKGKDKRGSSLAPTSAPAGHPQDAMVVDTSHAPVAPVRENLPNVSAYQEEEDRSDDYEGDEDDCRKRKKKGKGPAQPPPHDLHTPSRPPQESYGSGLSVELVTRRDGGSGMPYVVGRLGNYVRFGNHTLDARRPLPSRDPTIRDINPLTGERWRPAELRECPNGYYGLPANGREGIVDARQSRVAVAEADDPKNLLIGGEGPLPVALRRDLPRYHNDSSRAEMKFLWTGSYYRMPHSKKDFKAFEAVREKPGNWMAVQLWNRWVAKADVNPATRTGWQHNLLKYRSQRPSWVTDFPKPEPTTAPRRSLAERISHGAGVDTLQDNVLPPAGNQNTTTTGQEEDVPMGNDGNVPRDSGAESGLQDDPLLQTDATMHHTDSPEAGEIYDESREVYADEEVRVAGNTNGQSRGFVASVTDALLQPVCEWVKENRADIPGISLDEDGAVVSKTALRGFYRIAQTGPPSGLMTDVIEYARVVADALRSGQRVSLPRGTPLNLHFDKGSLEVDDVVKHLNHLAEETALELLEYDSPYNGASAVLAMDEWVQQVMLTAMDTEAE